MTGQLLAGLFFEISQEGTQIVAAVDDLILSGFFVFYIVVFFAVDRQAKIAPVIGPGQIDVFSFGYDVLESVISQGIGFHILSHHLIVAGVIADGIDRQTVADLADV